MKRLRRRLSQKFSKLSSNEEAGIAEIDESSEELTQSEGSYNFYESDQKCTSLPNVPVEGQSTMEGFESRNKQLTSVSEEDSNDAFLRKRVMSTTTSVDMWNKGLSTEKSTRRHSSPAWGADLSPYGKTETYQKLGLLGEGSYAMVYKGKSKHTGQLVALKEMTLNSDEGTPFTAIREASLLKTLRHANVITLHDIIHTGTTLTLVFEYMVSDLSAYMEWYGSAGINPRNAVLFSFQLLRGLDYCHKRRILHRDIKPQNLLLSEVGELKLADFGLARAKSIPTNTYSHEVVTLWYRPPDVLLGSRDYSTSLDIWGVGCIFLEMLTGVPAFPGQSNAADQLKKIFQVLGTPTPHNWKSLPHFPCYEELAKCFATPYPTVPFQEVCPRINKIDFGVEFAMSLLKFNPEKRLSADEALRHPVFHCYPEDIHNLPDRSSVLSVSGVQLSKEEASPTSSCVSFEVG